MKLNVKFDVIKEESAKAANVSFLKGTDELSERYKDILNNKLELEIQLDGLVKFSEQISSLGINAITLAQGVGSVLKEFT